MSDIKSCIEWYNRYNRITKYNITKFTHYKSNLSGIFFCDKLSANALSVDCTLKISAKLPVYGKLFYTGGIRELI